jgi:hypothetical protein
MRRHASYSPRRPLAATPGRGPRAPVPRARHNHIAVLGYQDPRVCMAPKPRGHVLASPPLTAGRPPTSPRRTVVSWPWTARCSRTRAHSQLMAKGRALAPVRARPHCPAMPAAPRFCRAWSPPQRGCNVAFALRPGQCGLSSNTSWRTPHTHTSPHALKPTRAQAALDLAATPDPKRDRHEGPARQGEQGALPLGPLCQRERGRKWTVGRPAELSRPTMPSQPVCPSRPAEPQAELTRLSQARLSWALSRPNHFRPKNQS